MPANEHLVVGRASMAGPVIGPYVMFKSGPIQIAAADAANTIHWAFECPCAMRIMELGWQSSRTGGAGVFLDFMHNTSASVTGATTINAAQVVLTTETGFANAETDGFTTLVPTARDVARGRVIMAVTNETGNTLADLTVYVLVYFTGHLVSPTTLD